MKKYEKLDMQVLPFTAEDVITTSGEEPEDPAPSCKPDVCAQTCKMQ